MRVVLAQPRGFCAGVVRAIDIVERALEKYGEPVYVRHEIVHNKHVVDTLKNKGRALRRGAGRGARRRGHRVQRPWRAAGGGQGRAGAGPSPCSTRPVRLVSKVHNQGKRYVAHGRRLILIGHAGHPEVEGTMGQVGAPVDLESSEADVDALTFDPSTAGGPTSPRPRSPSTTPSRSSPRSSANSPTSSGRRRPTSATPPEPPDRGARAGQGRGT